MTTTFAALGVPADLSRLLADRGIVEPFPIQAATLVDALAGHDVCGKAPTGSGKTLAFGIALAMRATYSRPRTPSALVLVPTRELADQVGKEIRPLAEARGARLATVYGGASYGPQRQALNRGVNIVVATPGRLEDLIATGDIRLGKVEIVVLDEADRMADMGFMPAVRRILDGVRPDRQTLLFSATLDGDVDHLVRTYQKNPRHHESAGVDDAGEVDHHFWNAPRDVRIKLTADIVAAHYRAIVFTRTRRGADRLTKQLNGFGVRSAAIHGDRSQAQRERALEDFRSDRVAALVATDVAARGIHVDDVPCVVHFDPPADAKDYVHRSGRTGRAGNRGTVVTLVDEPNRKGVKIIQRELGLPLHVANPPAELASPAAEAGAAPAAPRAERPPLRVEPSPSDRPRQRSRHGNGGYAGNGHANRGTGGNGGNPRRASGQGRPGTAAGAGAARGAARRGTSGGNGSSTGGYGGGTGNGRKRSAPPRRRSA